MAVRLLALLHSNSTETTFLCAMNDIWMAFGWAGPCGRVPFLLINRVAFDSIDLSESAVKSTLSITIRFTYLCHGKSDNFNHSSSFPGVPQGVFLKHYFLIYKEKSQTSRPRLRAFPSSLGKLY